MKRQGSTQDWAQLAHSLSDIRGIITRRLVPDAAAAHFRQAEKEALLGIRALLDGAIERLDEAAAEDGKPTGKRSASIQIED